MTPLETFAEFWSAYPRHVGKKAALKAWLKLNPAPGFVKEIIGAVTMQKQWRERAKAAGKWVPEWPHASTWLNGERWEDEAEAAPAGIYDGLAKFVGDGR